ncbi:hypothetical protein [Paenibacillus sp. OAS669]|uniref:hypothetical protein n=1 Tax=Paenibacillus sp. OAS669 TaxID=2663821 RepID=UPI00178B5F1F|nr:hypothetical protein [Paenibacillus sp. OAS669]MBE1442709.1 hypothetical protein [Paenibacillus sp. OAS669]
MKAALISTLMVALLCLSFFAFFIYVVFIDDEIGPFNVHDISADESELQIATDLSIGKGTRLLKTITLHNQIYSLFEAQPGEIGIAAFTPIAKKDRFKFEAATYSDNLIQAKPIMVNGNAGVVVGISKKSPIHHLTVMKAQESIEKKLTTEQDSLEIIHFKSPLSSDEILVVGYDISGNELARTMVKAEAQ